GRIINREDRTLSEVKKGSYKYFAENDIIIAKITPCMENGKCAIAKSLTNKIGFGSSEFHVFRCKEAILPEYLFCLLNREQVRKIAVKHMTGASGHRRVPIEFYENMTIPVPPLDVQKQVINEFNDVEEKIRVEEDFLIVAEANIKNKFNELFAPYSNDKNVSFETICVDDTKTGYKFDSSEYLERGDIPIIDQSINQIAGYKDLEPNKPPYNNLPCIIFGDHSETFKLVSEEFYLGADGTKIIIPLDRNKVNITFLYYQLFQEYKPSGKYERHFKYLKEMRFYIPPMEEQQKFADYVQSIESQKAEAVTRKEHLITQRNAIIDKYFR
ncbi:MAG: restriction endonuclease subunit S, partial [Selenomonadaceae bacterium]|nr:restriction endonuclease subunit S [Selenomonadaceae bacterium]